MAKPRLKTKFSVLCPCGCGQEFMTNRKNKTYKNKGHKMAAWKRDNRLIKTEAGEYEIIIKGKKYRIIPDEK